MRCSPLHNIPAAACDKIFTWRNNAAGLWGRSVRYLDFNPLTNVCQILNFEIYSQPERALINSPFTTSTHAIMPLDLSLTPVSSDALTLESLQDLLALALDLVNTLPKRIFAPSPLESTKISWSSAKGDEENKIWRATHNNEPWIARVSNFSDISYDVLRRGLLVEKSLSEKAAFLQENDEIENIGEEQFGDINVLSQDSCPPRP